MIKKNGKNSKERRKRNHRTPWRTILRKLGEKSTVAEVGPENTSRTCPRCGYVVRDEDKQGVQVP